MSDLNGSIATLSFNSNDNASVADAIRQMERAIDEKVSRFRGNKLVEFLAEGSKKSFAEAIRERACEASSG